MAQLEYWTGKPPCVRYLWVFDATTWVHIPKEKRRKLDLKSVKSVLVRYDENLGTRVYQLFDLEKKKFLWFQDIIIDKTTISNKPNE